ncbi:MAG: tRNA pseudouridine(55) synthase TruB [Lachnospiraceae bacterium]|nr:tRNA pseudouridine(55) synthase TruB [Lachnospiraceae bacterium]
MTNGVVNVRKEKGMTSFGVVARLRRIFGQKKIGHTGTLDPDAEGVLPICLGRATHLVEDLSRGTKTYRAVLLLGVETDTQDISGTVLLEKEVTVTEEEVREAIFSFQGKQKQLPPMYSAVKVNGQKLVDLARRGIEVERKEREVEFSEINILSVDFPRVTFEVTCSHGTYIRTLCHDIGQKLGCGACMESLLRLRVEDFTLEDALTVDEIARRKAEEDAEGRTDYSFVRKIDSFYGDLVPVQLPEALVASAVNGNSLDVGEVPSAQSLAVGERMRLYTPENDFVGVYKRGTNKIRLVRYFYEKENHADSK